MPIQPASLTADRNLCVRSFYGFPMNWSGDPCSSIQPLSKMQLRSEMSRAKPVWCVAIGMDRV